MSACLLTLGPSVCDEGQLHRSQRRLLSSLFLGILLITGDQDIMTQHGEQSEPTDPFFGTWVLDPTQSVYEAGLPPQSGSYRIVPEGDSLKFTMEWVVENGQHH